MSLLFGRFLRAVILSQIVLDSPKHSHIPSRLTLSSKRNEGLLNQVVRIPFAMLDEILRQFSYNLPVGSYVKTYLVRDGALQIEWTSRDQKEGE